MKPPVCKVCQKAHWTYDGHFVSEVEVPQYVKDMAKGALGYEKTIVVFPDPNPPETVTTVTKSSEVVFAEPVTQKTCNACNKPLHNRGQVCNACRQRAYRERSK